jgi:hypothetical protein
MHVVLPFDRDEFVEVSVRPAGEEWVARFDDCLDRAAAVHHATADRYLSDDHLFGYCSQLAMRLALLRGHHLSASVEQMAVWDATRSCNAPIFSARMSAAPRASSR